MKVKHNKKRNTAFLFETLVRELTKTAIEKNEQKKKKIVSIIKEFFSKEKLLFKELQLYKTLLESGNMTKNKAEKILVESKKQYDRLSKKKIFSEQSKLISEINKSLSQNIYSNFVPQYKDLATIYQIFNLDLLPTKRIILEEQLLDCMVNENSGQENVQVPIDNLTYKTFVESFNKEYKDDLLEEQKDLLNKYIVSYSDNGIEFKIYLNEEIERLRNGLNNVLNDKKGNLNENITTKFGMVLKNIDNMRKEEPDSKLVEKVLKIQALIREIQ